MGCGVLWCECVSSTRMCVFMDFDGCGIEAQIFQVYTFANHKIWYCRLIAKWVYTTKAYESLKPKKKTSEEWKILQRRQQHRRRSVQGAVIEREEEVEFILSEKRHTHTTPGLYSHTHINNQSHMKWNCSIWTSNEKFYSLLLLYFRFFFLIHSSFFQQFTTSTHIYCLIQSGQFFFHSFI